ncbi:hypothetical protein B7494_g1541 [Chlorociboria aeruginascens]|nr:hypothetical protein B7494_g1541 [Chlorociboria aeruginascens]
MKLKLEDIEKIEQEATETILKASSPSSFANKLNIASYALSPKPLASSSSVSSSPRAPLSISNFPQSPVKRKSNDIGLPGSPSPSKKSKNPGYAPPSKYAHLNPIEDALMPNLLCIFVGLNPGIQTARAGHAYSHPSNRFWKLLYSSGCTTRLCRPEEDRGLPRMFSLGHTNIVSRPTRNAMELSKEEMDASVEILEEKIRRFKPEVVTLVGKGIWESIWRVRHGISIKKEEFRYGWQNEEENMGAIEGEDGGEWHGARVFVATSTSGLAASVSAVERERIWKELGDWVQQRRKERSAVKIEAE